MRRVQSERKKKKKKDRKDSKRCLELGMSKSSLPRFDSDRKRAIQKFVADIVADGRG